MFVKPRINDRLVEVLELTDLFNPNHTEVMGRYH